MKLVLDCNVFVSAVANGVVCQAVLEIAFRQHQVFYSKEIIEELRTTFAKPKLKIFQSRGERLITDLQHLGTPVVILPLVPSLPDPGDEIYLATALAANAEILVTGNLKDFPPNLTTPVRVLSPRDFLELFRASYPPVK
ncbi:MAG: putative toxin-antitoxin system toxin component, PIN family [Magnetococcales bacterium]|nr:putative toxin-antitoxin system toxin component, PIN family [Magnetococcales bacterium]NGZ25530.1 putative toxin-antitoxin system toxin component, PIN family [Magnetococcales bacterium]